MHFIELYAIFGSPSDDSSPARSLVYAVRDKADALLPQTRTNHDLKIYAKKQDYYDLHISNNLAAVKAEMDYSGFPNEHIISAFEFLNWGLFKCEEARRESLRSLILKNTEYCMGLSRQLTCALYALSHHSDSRQSFENEMSELVTRTLDGEAAKMLLDMKETTRTA
jgi:hypothetical protein